MERISERVQEQKEKPKQMDLFEENFLKREVRAEYKLIGQVFDTYWLVEFQDKLYIIDQHAAHERVLYENSEIYANQGIHLADDQSADCIEFKYAGSRIAEHLYGPVYKDRVRD